MALLATSVDGRAATWDKLLQLELAVQLFGIINECVNEKKYLAEYVRRNFSAEHRAIAMVTIYSRQLKRIFLVNKT